MKAKLEFDLDDPSDKKAHLRCTKATEAYIALHEIDQELRAMVKYEKGIATGTKIGLPEGYHEITTKESELLYEVVWNLRREIGSIMEKLGIDLNDLE